jgi:hypothetical protein
VLGPKESSYRVAASLAASNDALFRRLISIPPTKRPLCSKIWGSCVCRSRKRKLFHFSQEIVNFLAQFPWLNWEPGFLFHFVYPQLACLYW